MAYSMQHENEKRRVFRVCALVFESNRDEEKRREPLLAFDGTRILRSLASLYVRKCTTLLGSSTAALVGWQQNAPKVNA